MNGFLNEFLKENPEDDSHSASLLNMEIKNAKFWQSVIKC